MHFVYILQSERFPERLYKGSTGDIERRLQHHNSGASPHTAKYLPWKMIYFAGFARPEQARAFEAYLKSGSGIAFMRKRLI